MFAAQCLLFIDFINAESPGNRSNIHDNNNNNSVHIASATLQKKLLLFKTYCVCVMQRFGCTTQKVVYMLRSSCRPNGCIKMFLAVAVVTACHRLGSKVARLVMVQHLIVLISS